MGCKQICPNTWKGSQRFLAAGMIHIISIDELEKYVTRFCWDSIDNQTNAVHSIICKLLQQYGKSNNWQGSDSTKHLRDYYMVYQVCQRYQKQKHNALQNDIIPYLWALLLAKILVIKSAYAWSALLRAIMSGGCFSQPWNTLFSKLHLVKGMAFEE